MLPVFPQKSSAELLTMSLQFTYILIVSANVVVYFINKKYDRLAKLSINQNSESFTAKEAI